MLFSRTGSSKTVIFINTIQQPMKFFLVATAVILKPTLSKYVCYLCLLSDHSD